MNEKQIEELMVDYAEMTSLDFSSDNFLQVQALQQSGGEYSDKPYSGKYGSFDLLDMLHSLISREV